MFEELENFLLKIPAIIGPIGSGSNGIGWWAKFHIDVEHGLSWQVVQELAHVLNYISINEPLPTVFKPVSPPPYLNGGPQEFLSWIIECQDVQFHPKICAEWLEKHLPQPVDSEDAWSLE